MAGLTSNNAPQPIPGGYGNPSGTNSFKFASPTTATTQAPVFPAYGSVPTSGPQANNPLFSGTNIQGLSTGFGVNGQLGANWLRELQDTYGKGLGSALDQLLGKGFFNPQVAASFLNALQPGIQRGEADILQAFGAEGARFGSTAAIGLGDYNSQVQLNEQQTLASLYENAQNQELSLLSQLLPGLQESQANRGSSGLFGDILGGLEAVGGAIAASFTGGATIPLIGAGISTIAGSNGGGGGGGSQASAIQQTVQNLFNKYKAGQTQTSIGSGSDVGVITQGGGIGDPGFIPTLSAGANLGATDPFSNNDSGDNNNSLLQYMIAQGLISPSDIYSLAIPRGA